VENNVLGQHPARKRRPNQQTFCRRWFLRWRLCYRCRCWEWWHDVQWIIDWREFIDSSCCM